MIRNFIESIGSKRLSAALTIPFVLLATLIAGIIAKKAGIELSPATLLTYSGLASSGVVAFIFSQWHLDVSTGGKTTTAFLVAFKIAKAVDDATLGAKGAGAVLNEVAKVVEAVSDPDPAALTPVHSAAPASAPPAPAAVASPSTPPAQ